MVDADRTIEEVEKDVQKIAKEAVERCKKGTEANILSLDGKSITNS